MKLRCQITDLSISSNIEISEIQNYLSSAIIEVRNLLDNTRHTPEQRENLRKKYYLRVLVPLGEVRIQFPFQGRNRVLQPLKAENH